MTTCDPPIGSAPSPHDLERSPSHFMSTFPPRMSMARGAQKNQVLEPGSPAGNAILGGASSFRVDRASFVGGNSYQVNIHGKQVQYRGRKKIPRRRPFRRSQSVDAIFSNHVPHGEIGLDCDETPMAREQLSGSDDQCNEALRTGSENPRLPLLDEPLRTVDSREGKVPEAERQFGTEFERWKEALEDAQRSISEREGKVAKREHDVSIRMTELEVREEQLREASIQVKEEQSRVHQKSLDLERREIETQRRLSELETRSKRLDAIETNLQMEEHSLILRSQDLERLGAWRREELRRQLGDSHVSLLKYTTLALEKAFGRHNSLGAEYVLRQFKFENIDTGDLDKKDGLYLPIAPFYDGIDKWEVLTLPSNLKIAIAGVIKALQENLTDRQRNNTTDGRALENILTTTLELQPAGEKVVSRERLEFARDLKPSELSVVREWLESLIGHDGHVSSVTPGAFRKIPDYITPTDAKKAPKPPNTKKILDLTALWFPSHRRRLFKLSRTSIVLWTTQTQSRLGRTKHTTTLCLEHMAGSVYYPRDEFINAMSEESRNIAIGFTDHLFDSE